MNDFTDIEEKQNQNLEEEIEDDSPYEDDFLNENSPFQFKGRKQNVYNMGMKI